MIIDFSILKNIDLSILGKIDFKNSENILFLSIILFLVIVFIFLVFFLVFEVIKIIKKIINRIFNIEAKRPKFSQKDSEWLHHPEDDKKIPNMPAMKIMGGDFIKTQKTEEKKTTESSKEKTEKDVAERLSKLKSSGSENGETLESKMPSRTEDQEEDNHERIKIPRAKEFSSGGLSEKTENNDTQIKGDVRGVDGFNKATVETNSGVVNSGVSNPDKHQNYKGSSSANIGSISNESATRPDQPAKTTDGISPQIKKEDLSIFNGGTEVSRRKLEYEMRKDTNIWKAAKQEGLNLSPVERTKLAKEVLSSNLGRNISKRDLKLSVKKLNEKMLSTKDSAEHAKLRKEIKFFKKIGGIK